jgi:hypothetical protein
VVFSFPKPDLRLEGRCHFQIFNQSMKSYDIFCSFTFHFVWNMNILLSSGKFEVHYFSRFFICFHLVSKKTFKILIIVDLVTDF